MIVDVTLVSIACLFTGFQALKAQYPIPSYNIPVYPHATFQEQVAGGGNSDNCTEKRQVVIRTSCGNLARGNCSATVWVYSLDGKTVYGPYTVYGGETLRVDIDDREWGVYVEAEDTVIVDVWIE